MEYVLFFRIVFAHVVISFVSNRIPYRHLEKVRKHLQVCEAEIRFYERSCHIKKWKDLVPSAGPFDKRNLKDDSLEYLSVFILETVRAEVAHVSCIIASMMILLSSPLGVSPEMALFFLIINLPCIMIQRCNRPRLERILRRKCGNITVPEFELRDMELLRKKD